MERQIPLAVVTRVMMIRVVRRMQTKLRVVVVRMSPTTTTKVLTMMTVWRLSTSVGRTDANKRNYTSRTD